MKGKFRISPLTLEFYHRGLATPEEKAQIEKALKTDNEVRKQYEEIQNSEQEIRLLFQKELQRQNITVKPAPRISKTAWGAIAAAAVVLAAMIPAILYLKGSGADIDNPIAEETTQEIYPSESTEIAEDIPVENTSIEDKTQSSEQPAQRQRSNANERTFITESPSPELNRTEEPVLQAEPENNVSIAAAPEPDTGIRMRGSQTEEETSPPEPGSNLNIPPGITFIFENMFRDQGLIWVSIPYRIKSIGQNAFSGNPVMIVTIGPDVSIENNAIPGNFAAAYNGYGKAAGTYSRPNTNSEEWTRD